MRRNTINNLMKKMIENLTLSGINKKITNHSARKALVNTFKQNKIPKSEIISITGHNTEAALDAYDSGDKEHQKTIYFAIDNHERKPETWQISLKSHHIF